MQRSVQDHWKGLSEDELWALATNPTYPRLVREEAMRRWLLPKEYGYSWSNRRTDQARRAAQAVHLAQQPMW